MRFAPLSILVLLASVSVGCAGSEKVLHTADSAVQAEPRRVSEGRPVWSYAPHAAPASGSSHPDLF